MPPTAPTYFATPAAFRRWLATHHATATELLVGFWKVGSGTPSITWPESVDEALAVGWIDGVRKRIDDARYTIRFTPRRPTSIWSAVNIRRVEALRKEGRMRPAGEAAFARRTPEKSGVYSYEQEPGAGQPPLDAAVMRRLRADRAAWAFLQAQPPYYWKLITHWIGSARRPATRDARIERLLSASVQGKRVT